MEDLAVIGGIIGGFLSFSTLLVKEIRGLREDLKHFAEQDRKERDALLALAASVREMRSKLRDVVHSVNGHAQIVNGLPCMMNEHGFSVDEISVPDEDDYELVDKLINDSGSE